MAYSAYEREAHKALDLCQNWCRHLTQNGVFTNESRPSITEVEDFLTLGQAELAAELTRYGFGTAAGTTPMALAWLENMNGLKACMKIEMTYPITEWGQPNERMAMFREDWNAGIENLKSGQLANIGLTVSASDAANDTILMTGTSKSRMDDRDADTDRVAGKFKRDFGQRRDVSALRRNPNVID